MAKVIRTSRVMLGGVVVGSPSPSGTWPSTLDNQTVDFNRDEFVRLLSDKGYSIRWEKAMFCPNMPANMLKPRDHDINCTICDGSGFYYYASEETPMLMTGMSLQQSFAAFGRWDPGRSMVTALPEKRLHYWDRLTLLNGIGRFFEKVSRTVDTKFDKLKYAPLTIEAVTWLSRTGTLRTYVIDQEVEMTADGLKWLIDVGLPDNNTPFSVAYTYRPRYVVQDLTHQHRDSTINGEHYEFPTQAVAKLDFLTRDESLDAATTHFTNPLEQ